MADPHHDPQADTGAQSQGDAPTGLARWQKVLAIIGVLVVIALALLLLGGEHGPGRHASDPDQEPAAAVEHARDQNRSRHLA